MKLLITKNGMRVAKSKPMWFDSFYVSFLSSKYKNARPPRNEGKTNWLAAAWNGFASNLAALFDPQKCSSVIYIISK